MADSGKIPEPDSQEPADLLRLALPISQKVVLVIDLVESVRLMAANEAGVVARWHDFAQHAQNHTIPAHNGRLVKSLGDGLMVEFEEPRHAVNAALALHAAIAKANPTLAEEQRMHLRAGVNATHVYTDHNDIYGAGVNLAARIATLAGPGETVVTAQVRDGLTDGLDASIEDLGECYLKHIEQPVRAYRVGAAGAAPVVVAQREYATLLQPTIAVIPFTSRSNEPEHVAIGELIADGVISQLSQISDLRIISRLSATVFRGRGTSAVDIERHLGAEYVLSGSYFVHGSSSGGKLLIQAEMASSKTGTVVWAERMNGEVGDLLIAQSELINALASKVHLHVVQGAILAATTSPLPTLQSYSLMLAASQGMTRFAKPTFERSRDFLECLVDRHSRHPVPPAMLAYWYHLRISQGWSPQIEADSQRAISMAAKSVELAPENPVSLVIDGVVHAHLLKDMATARSRYQAALSLDASEPRAWMHLAAYHAFNDEGDLAVEASQKALACSPLDPMAFQYLTVAATACITADRHSEAVTFAQRATLQNRYHASSWRSLIIAQVLSGQVEEARSTAKTFAQLYPSYTVAQFLSRSPGVRVGRGAEYAKALAIAGVAN